eukprot:901671-Heterocapsa_arctica.AAC.1
METHVGAPAGLHPGVAGGIDVGVPVPRRRHGWLDDVRTGGEQRREGEEKEGPSLAARPEG